jgi:serine/threonine protein phosphatase 1
MATFAVGDIHGNLDALRDLLDQLALEAGRGDTIVFLGDYVDRGRDSKGCIDAILGFEQSVDAEVAAIRSYSAHAEETIRAAATGATGALYGGTVQLPYDAFFDCVPRDHIQFFEGLRLCYHNPDGICSHGGLDPRVADLREQKRMALIWGAGGFPESCRGDQVVVYGHRDNALVNGDGWPLPAEEVGTIGIDTISHGVLTAIRLPDRRVFQSARYITNRHDA